MARAAFLVRAGDASRIDPAELGQAVAEGLTLAEFNAGSYKTGDIRRRARPRRGRLCLRRAPTAERPRSRDAVQRGRLLGECSNLARELCNEPGNTLTPREFARRVGATSSRAAA